MDGDFFPGNEKRKKIKQPDSASSFAQLLILDLLGWERIKTTSPTASLYEGSGVPVPEKNSFRSKGHVYLVLCPPRLYLPFLPSNTSYGHSGGKECGIKHLKRAGGRTFCAPQPVPYSSNPTFSKTRQ